MKYAGSCHCQKVRYEVEVDLKQAISCNCSVCSKRGSLLVFVPEENFKLLSGEGALTDYQFNKFIIHHYFCSTCGVSSFAAGVGEGGKSMRAINIRCLDGVDIEQTPLIKFDGKNL